MLIIRNIRILNISYYTVLSWRRLRLKSRQSSIHALLHRILPSFVWWFMSFCMLKGGLLKNGKTIRMILYDDEAVFSIICNWKHTCWNNDKRCRRMLNQACILYRYEASTIRKIRHISRLRSERVFSSLTSGISHITRDWFLSKKVVWKCMFFVFFSTFAPGWMFYIYTTVENRHKEKT